MTSLVGKFEFDLPLRPVTDACLEAIETLGWEIESVESHRIVSYANGGSAQNPPMIEVSFRESGEATEVRIMGSDSDPDPRENDALVAELDRARDAVEASIEDAIGASAEGRGERNGESPPPQPDRPQFAAQRGRLRVKVLENGGALVVPVSDLLAEFGLPEFNPRAMDTIEALLRTVGLQATPRLAGVTAKDSVTLTPTGSGNFHTVAEPSRPRSSGLPAAAETRTASTEAVRTEAPEALQAPETNRLAIASLVLSVVWLMGAGSLLAILLGGMAQRQIDQSAGEERGRELATAGIVIGTIGAIAAIIAVIAIAGPSGS